MVRLPDTTGQLKSAKDVPARVIRGFFAGIGQLLLAADRFRADEEQREGGEHHGHDSPPSGLDGEHAPHQMTTADYVRSAMPPIAKRKRSTRPRAFRSLDSTGNVRVLTPEMPAESSPEDDQPAPGTRTRKPARKPSAKIKGIEEEKTALSDAESSPTREPVPAQPGAAPPTAEVGFPVPGYDGLSVASLRARLRNLDATQVRILLEHERSAGNRADVVGMLERRVAKLEASRDAP
jgi:hypothetical protein